MKRLIIAAITVAAMGIGSRAEAAQIVGTFSIVGIGGFTLYNGPGYTNPSTNAMTANVLDFGANGSGTGVWVPTGCSLDFTVILAPCSVAPAGSITDIDISSGVGAFNVSNFMTGANGLVIDLSSISLIDRNTNHQLTVQGFGTVIATGYQSTPVFWNFTANSAASGGTVTFSWSSSQSAIAAVPEPGSMVLLGTGLLGLAAIARRRLQNKA